MVTTENVFEGCMVIWMLVEASRHRLQNDMSPPTIRYFYSM